VSCGVSASVDAHKAARPSSEHFDGLPCDPPHQTALKPSRSRQLTFSCDTETCSPGLTILRRRRPAPSTHRIVSVLLIGGINLDRADNCGEASAGGRSGTRSKSSRDWSVKTGTLQSAAQHHRSRQSFSSVVTPHSLPH